MGSIVREQQRVWLNEHSVPEALPMLASDVPSTGVVQFTDYLASQHVALEGSAVDIGAGKGRNSVHLASLGFEVHALEYIQVALDAAKRLAADRALEGRIHFELAEIDRPWRFEDETFSVAIDSFASIDIETRAGRELCRNEMYRTLRRGGYALVTVCSVDDEWERALRAAHPGPETNSTVCPETGRFQKNYDERELLDFYRMFDVIDLQRVNKPVFKLGRQGIVTSLWLVLRKGD